MRSPNGIILDNFPIDNLRKVAELIYFEGPLLVWFETDAGDDYFFYWCESDENINRWIVFRVENSKLIDYINRSTTLRELLLHARDGFVYIVDINSNADYVNTFFVKPSDLPENYVPSPDSYYEFEPEFAPGRHALANRNRYRVSIGRQWSLEDLYEFPQNIRLFTHSYTRFVSLIEIIFHLSV